MSSRLGITRASAKRRASRPWSTMKLLMPDAELVLELEHRPGFASMADARWRRR